MCARRLLPLICAGLIGLAAGAGGARVGALDPALRDRALESGRVGPGLVAALERGEHPRVVIAFDPDHRPGAAGRGQRRRPTAPRSRASIRAAQDGVLARFGAGDFTLRHRYRTVNALAGRLRARGLERLLESPEVARVDLDEGGSGHLTESLPLVRLDAVGATLGLDGSGTKVAVVDSGVDLLHTDLQGTVVSEQCFCFDQGLGCCPGGGTQQSGAGAAMDDHGHGTNVTGIVTADGITAPAGGAPVAEIVAVKVLDQSNGFCCVSDVVAALDWINLNEPDVDVVNLSLGTFATYAGDCDAATSGTMALANAINALRANEIASVVSAGNDGLDDRMSAPACISSAISVGAVWDDDVGFQNVLGCVDASTEADLVTCFSNSSSTTDLFGPGAPVRSTRLYGGSSTFSGTSQAAPMVSACIATLRQAWPAATVDQMESALELSGVTVPHPTSGLDFPRLRCVAAHVALAEILGPEVPIAGGWAAGTLLVALAGAGLALLRPRRRRPTLPGPS